MARMARRVVHVEPLDLLPAREDRDPLLGHGRDLAPELLHLVAVEALGAFQEPRRVDHVRRADLVDEDLELGKAASEDARGARVVEVDVGEKQHARLGLEAFEQRLDGRAGPGIDDHARPHLPRADHAIAPQMHGVDEVGHRRERRQCPLDHRIDIWPQITACRSPIAPGSCAPTRGTPTPAARTSSTARTSRRARPVSRSPSTSPPRPVTTPTRCSRAARSARSASRSPTRATCTRSSTRSRSAR